MSAIVTVSAKGIAEDLKARFGLVEFSHADADDAATVAELQELARLGYLCIQQDFFGDLRYSNKIMPVMDA